MSFIIVKINIDPIEEFSVFRFCLFYNQFFVLYFRFFVVAVTAIVNDS